jgi:chitinase
MPTEEIDWSAFSHLIYFALQARPDGSLAGLGPDQNMTPGGIREIVSAGQENGVPVLICIGGWGNYNGFSQAIQPGSRSNFVNNIVNTVIEWGFDGVDVNMEPIEPSDHENYAAFVNELYDRLQTLETPILPRPIMTAAVHWEPELISRVQNRFDQINIMTYNLSGAFTDWVTWHNSPLENGGYNFPGYERKLPSVNMDVDEYLSAGISPERLGIGIHFYGYVWTGVSTPQEGWNNQNPPWVESEVPYSTIMDEYFQEYYYRWDDTAQAPYLSIETGNRRQFVSFDNEQSIELKSDLVRERGLGGTIIWDLGGAYRSNQPQGERDRLLQVVKGSFLDN